jgi:amino acid transporter
MESSETVVGGSGVEAKAASPAGVAPKQYARKASGLMRSVSAWDVFGLGAGNSLLGLGIAFILVYVPFLYAGASVYLSVVLCGILVLPGILVYLKLSIVYPRSGGEYVYGSRVLHPVLGFGANVCFAVGMCFYVGLGGAYVVGYGLAPMLQVAGVQLGNMSMVNAGTWLIGKSGTFLVGAVLILVFATVLTVWGTRTYYRIQGVLVVLGSASLIFIGIWGLVASKATAMANLDQLFGALGMGQASALAAGSLPGFSFSQTLYSLVWPSVFMVAAYYGVYVGGEVKSPQRTQIIGGMSAWGYMIAVPLLVLAGCAAVFGLPFFMNLSAAMAQSTFGVAGAPSFAALVAGAIGNGYVTILLLCGFMAFPLVMVGAILILVSRCIFAWSIDRVMPDALSKVSSRSHQPYVATWIAAIVSILYAFFVSYGYMTALAANWGFFIAEAVAFAAAVLLPYRRRGLWESSPGSRRILGLPDIVVLSILAMPLFVFSIWRCLVDVNIGVTPLHNFPQFISFFIIFVVAVVVYFIAKAVRAGQGVDIARNYKEIPPE